MLQGELAGKMIANVWQMRPYMSLILSGALYCVRKTCLVHYAGPFLSKDVLKSVVLRSSSRHFQTQTQCVMRLKVLSLQFLESCFVLNLY